MARREKGHRAPALIFSFTALIIVVFSEEYVTEFDKDNFWTEVVDGSQGKASWKRSEWKQGDSIPEPEGDRWLLELVLDSGSTGTARLRSPDLNFTDGAFINITFWITSKSPESSNLKIYKTVDNKEEYPALLDLTSYSKPDNRKWTEMQGFIPLGSKTRDTFKLTIYGYKNGDPEAAVVIDQVVVNTDGKPPDAAISSTPESATTTSNPPHPPTTTSKLPHPPTTTPTSHTLVTTSSATEQVITGKPPTMVLGTEVTKDSRPTADTSLTKPETGWASVDSVSVEDSTQGTGAGEEAAADDKSETLLSFFFLFHRKEGSSGH